jgi:hypothetical protein
MGNQHSRDSYASGTRASWVCAEAAAYVSRLCRGGVSRPVARLSGGCCGIPAGGVRGSLTHACGGKMGPSKPRAAGSMRAVGRDLCGSRTGPVARIGSA